MILRGIQFGRVWGASGVQSFFGEGYWFHRPWKLLGFFHDLDESVTFVAKTTTFHAREGNMPLDGRFRPRELFPRCIVLKPWQGVVLN